MKNILCVLFAFLFPLSTISYAANTNTALNTQLQNIVNTARKQFGVSAIALSILAPKKQLALNILSGKTKKGGGETLKIDNLFQIGSDTKSFTTAILLLLQSQDKLSINDTLGKWLPQYKKWAHIKIIYLLHNNSGIPNYTESKKFQKILFTKPKTQWTNKRLVSYAYDMPIMFQPGHGWHYCNTNFVLAGMIVKKASGKSLSELFKKYFLGKSKLNLSNTYYTPHQYKPQIAKRMVHGYNDEGKDITFTNLSWAGPAGAMVSNAQNLVRWDYLLFNNKVVPKNQLTQMKKTVDVKTGKPNTTHADAGYGMAIGFRKNKAGLWWGHEGETLGYHAIFAYYPKSNIYIAITTNGLKGTDLRSLIEKIALAITN